MFCVCKYVFVCIWPSCGGYTSNDGDDDDDDDDDLLSTSLRWAWPSRG